MFGRRFRLMRVLGIDIKLDITWVILFLLVTWSLSRGLFPIRYGNLRPEAYWWMGVAAAIGLFVSLILHELCHAAVAKRYGIPISGITLFIFGGVAEMDDEPPSAGSEFAMAIVGPLCSIALGIGASLLAMAGNRFAWPVSVVGVFSYLAWINYLLAAFNLLPGFPLDGGRVLRAALWQIKGDVKWATRIAAGCGTALGILLSLYGLYRVFRWDFVGGIWYFLIGMFLQEAAQSAYQHLLIRRSFEGERVRRFMTPNPVTVSLGVTLRELVEEFFYRHPYKIFPVVSEGHLIGCVSVDQVRDIPREDWDRRTVAQVATSCSPDNAIGPDSGLLEALSVMNRTGASNLLVVEGDQVLGMITLRDLLNFLAIKMELEGARSRDDGHHLPPGLPA